ncbi:hypothetical protein SADO_14043 [Salinisphaera dokdonensis CL-ES53]|uniref:Uncharacterized protein n=1 Tax=Salinisphaera dokdonensis CL-ES53 TaxID=1304272 RepID=A0ABV2B3B1_9GAMM
MNFSSLTASVRAAGLSGTLLIVLFSPLSLAALAEDDFAAPIAEQELATHRGREGTTIIDIVSSTSRQDGLVIDSVATGNNNGGNVIRDAAFSGVRGHATVIQNSGNNNVIQDSTIYNFSISP